MKIAVNDIKLNVEVSGKKDGPNVILSHSLACNLEMWDDQVQVLKDRYCVVRYDTRGHGLSDAPEGQYDLQMLGSDAIAMMNELGLEKAHWIGISMGGMIGQYLAINHPDRVSSLCLCDTGPAMPEEAQPLWQARIDDVLVGGMKARLESTLEGWFTTEMLLENDPVVSKISRQFLSTPISGYIGCIWAIRGLNLVDRLNEIEQKTLIVVGQEDLGTPVAVSQLMHDLIPGSELVVLSNAAHLSTLAQPNLFNRALTGFLDGI